MLLLWAQMLDLVIIYDSQQGRSQRFKKGGGRYQKSAYATSRHYQKSAMLHASQHYQKNAYVARAARNF